MKIVDESAAGAAYVDRSIDRSIVVNMEKDMAHAVVTTCASTVIGPNNNERVKIFWDDVLAFASSDGRSTFWCGNELTVHLYVHR
jgi:hypothetical protein